MKLNFPNFYGQSNQVDGFSDELGKKSLTLDYFFSNFSHSLDLLHPRFAAELYSHFSKCLLFFEVLI
jgi:hypothetical protein